jgi:predicted ester cyclase
MRSERRETGAEDNKQLVRQLVREAVGERNLAILDELAAGEFAELAKRWVAPFRSAFPDFQMEIVDLIAEGDKVAAHFKCSGTHRGEWLGVPATGRRFDGVEEIYIFSSPRRQIGVSSWGRGQPDAASPARHRTPERSLSRDFAAVQRTHPIEAGAASATRPLADQC